MFVSSRVGIVAIDMIAKSVGGTAPHSSNVRIGERAAILLLLNLFTCKVSAMNLSQPRVIRRAVCGILAAELVLSLSLPLEYTDIGGFALCIFSN
jgi:hypothetical protein